ncbi:MAG: hypothetical protein HY561_12285 [Gemmatimonadetes bacterium]|nr:hypothetical protein [Gemmatimonadota bacterium]
MDSPAIPVFLAGPFPVVHTAKIHDPDEEVELDVALIIGGLPTILAATRFPLDDTWERIEAALTSGDARLGVAGVPHESESSVGSRQVFPSAYIGLECANGERLVLAHIRAPNTRQDAERYAREVMGAILQGQTPAELGEIIDDD